jgi:hypothetical protein
MELRERPQGEAVPRAKVSLGLGVARKLKRLENPMTVEPVLGAPEIAQELRQTAKESARGPGSAQRTGRYWLQEPMKQEPPGSWGMGPGQVLAQLIPAGVILEEERGTRAGAAPDLPLVRAREQAPLLAVALFPGLAQALEKGRQPG